MTSAPSPFWRGRSALTAATFVTFVVVGTGCGQAATAETLLELDAFRDPRVGDLRGVKAELSVLDSEGDPATGTVVVDGESYRVESPFPLSCDGQVCELSLQVRPGDYSFALDLFSEDRCGNQSQIVRMSTTGTITLVAALPTTVTFTETDSSFDDDGDGISNGFELLTCGRFDAADDDRVWTSCIDPEHPCCVAPPDARVGVQTFFDSQTFVNRVGTDVTVDGLYVDATEVTWGTLRKCVSAGACLVDAPDHIAWASIVDPSVLDAAPVVNLVPSEAQTLCGWLGKSLPTDDQWDRIAAARSDGSRSRFPWDETGTIGCRPDTGDSVHANHKANGESCFREAQPVGSFPTSDVFRGDGPGVADLAGNVGEWTVVRSLAPVATFAEIPAGVSEVFVRGGGFDSIPEFLENDFAYDLLLPEPFELNRVAAFLDFVRAVAATTGFRCVSESPAPTRAAECTSDAAPVP